jgi:high affinity sulfate transporter 1
MFLDEGWKEINWDEIASKLKSGARSYVPVLEWLPKYDRTFLKTDAIAGITTGAVLVPSAMAYATLVGIPPEYGLYASIVTLFVYFIFGTSKHLVVVPSSGPVALAGAGILALGITEQSQIIAVVGFLALLTGLFLIIARLIKLGFLVNFISETVLVGFQIGLALYVISLQIGKVTGIPGGSGEFFDRISYYLTHLNLIDLPTLAFSIGGLAFLVVLEKVLPKFPSKLILLVVATVLVIVFSLTEYGIDVVGSIPNGLPEFVIPNTAGVGIAELLPIVSGLFLITFVEGISIAKTFARQGKYKIDSNQELLGYGAPNFVTAFFQGMPSDASSSNTSLTYQAGAKTQVAGLVASLVVVTVVLFFASFFGNLPSAIIGVIIIMAMVNMINYRELVKILRFNRVEFVFAFITLLGVLLYGLLQGVFIGVAITFLVVLYQISMPYVATLGKVPGTNSFSDIRRSPNNEKLPGILIVRVDGSLFFPSLQKVTDEINKKILEEEGPLKLVVLSLSASPYIDLGATKMIRDTYHELRDRGIEFKLSDITGTNRDVIRKAGLEEELGPIDSFVTVDQAIAEWQMKNAKPTDIPLGEK